MPLDALIASALAQHYALDLPRTASLFPGNANAGRIEGDCGAVPRQFQRIADRGAYSRLIFTKARIAKKYSRNVCYGWKSGHSDTALGVR